MRRLILILVLISLPIGMVPAAPLVASGGPRAGQITHTTAADFAQGKLDGAAISREGDGEVIVARGAMQGLYTSPVVKADFRFNAVGLIWDDNLPGLHLVEFEMRTSLDGWVWKDWRSVEDGDVLTKTDKHSSELFFTYGNYVQYRLNLTASDKGPSPVVRAITVKYIDSTSGPDITAAVRMASTARALEMIPAGQPTIISRAAWGVYSSCPNGPIPYWPPEYATTRVAVVHHTDTPMDTDPAVAVRAIWVDHACYNGWGDIGYNYLVGADGNIYEGRFGGDNVIGGHAGGHGGINYNSGSLGVAIVGTYSSVSPGPVPLASLESLLAWKLDRFGIDPKGAGWFYDRWLDNITGHRNVSQTACPGDALYARLPGIRNRVKFKTVWGAHSTPQKMLPRQTAWVNVQVQNTGAGVWTTGGSYPFDLGYHWYDSSGVRFIQSGQDDHRTAVPQPVGYNQWVNISALLTAPTTPGTYRLEWDMVQEGVAWFTDYGSYPLVTTVVVDPTTPTPTPTATPTSTPTATPTPIPPTLAVDPAFLGFVTLPGDTPGTQRIQIRNTGTGTFTWQASPSADWLRIDRSSGSPGDWLVISVDQSPLGSAPTPQARDATIVISAGSGNTVLGSPRTVAVHLVIASQVYDSYFPLVYKGYGTGW